MENDFINFKGKENQPVNQIQHVQLMHNSSTKNDLTASALIQVKRQTFNNNATLPSTKNLNFKNVDKMKDFLFNPDLQGQGKCYDNQDLISFRGNGTRISKNYPYRVRFPDLTVARRGGEHLANAFMPDFNLGNKVDRNSILKQNKKFSINKSRNSIKHFLNALEAHTKQSKYRVSYAKMNI
jgi:hypothetical protein